jgi:hypothetical protein
MGTSKNKFKGIREVTKKKEKITVAKKTPKKLSIKVAKKVAKKGTKNTAKKHPGRKQRKIN